jgi:hypothetical protein
MIVLKAPAGSDVGAEPIGVTPAHEVPTFVTVTRNASDVLNAPLGPETRM